MVMAIQNYSYSNVTQEEKNEKYCRQNIRRGVGR